MLTVILVGGASRRMGRDKALLEYNGETMVQTLIDRYAAAFGEAAVSVNRAGRFRVRGAAELVDPFPDCGPLNGIIAGFDYTQDDMLFLTATDIPRGTPELAARLAEMCGEHDACVIKSGPKGVEPLFAVYRRSCRDAAAEALGSGRRSFRAVFDKLNVRFVTPEELDGFDLDYILDNVNTPEEYEKILRSARDAE